MVLRNTFVAFLAIFLKNSIFLLDSIFFGSMAENVFFVLFVLQICHYIFTVLKKFQYIWIVFELCAVVISWLQSALYQTEGQKVLYKIVFVSDVLDPTERIYNHLNLGNMELQFWYPWAYSRTWNQLRNSTPSSLVPPLSNPLGNIRCFPNLKVRLDKIPSVLDVVSCNVM